MDKIRLHLVIKLRWKKPKLTYNAQEKSNTKQTKKTQPNTPSNFFLKKLFRKSYNGKSIFRIQNLLSISRSSMSFFPSFYKEIEISALKANYQLIFQM